MSKIYIIYLTILALYCIISSTISFATNPMLFIIISILPIAIVIAIYVLVYIWLKEIVKVIQKEKDDEE